MEVVKFLGGDQPDFRRRAKCTSQAKYLTQASLHPVRLARLIARRGWVQGAPASIALHHRSALRPRGCGRGMTSTSVTIGGTYGDGPLMGRLPLVTLFTGERSIQTRARHRLLPVGGRRDSPKAGMKSTHTFLSGRL